MAFPLAAIPVIESLTVCFVFIVAVKVERFTRNKADYLNNYIIRKFILSILKS
jgi:hypothetical protein